MAVTKKNKFGQVSISIDAIASVAGDTALECYGVVGIANRSSVHEVIAEILKKESFAKGIVIDKEKNGYSLSLYLVIAPNVKITEVLSEVQKKVKYDLERSFGIKVYKLHVFAQDINNKK